MNSTEIVLQFLAFLAQVRAAFRQVHLFAEKSPALRTVSTAVIPVEVKPSDYADKGVTICVALDAELRKPIDSERKSLGISLLLRHTRGMWLAEAEIGWTGKKIGWNSFDSKEAQGKSIDEIMNTIPPMVEWMDRRFKEEVARLPK